MTFAERFGPWALVAGASEGLGAALARQLADRGLSLVLVARRQQLLDQMAAELPVRVRTLCLDLADEALPGRLELATRDLELGLVVYNAALSVVEPFLDVELETHLRAVDLNCRGPLVLAHLYGPAMVARGRGGILLMSSLAGNQGSALLATYAASKAFNTLLAESLWAELRQSGVRVLACQAGATRTPGYLESAPRTGLVHRLLAPALPPGRVAAEALDALARGDRGSMIPGRRNRLAALVMQRLLPRRVATTLMGRTTRRLYPR